MPSPNGLRARAVATGGDPTGGQGRPCPYSLPNSANSVETPLSS